MHAPASALALTVLLAASALAAPSFASKAEFTKAIVGKTISSTTRTGFPFSAVIRPDGTGGFQRQGNPPATFKWTFTGQTFCWDFGDFKECSKVEIISPKAANFYDDKTGNLNNVYKIQ